MSSKLEPYGPKILLAFLLLLLLLVVVIYWFIDNKKEGFNNNRKRKTMKSDWGSGLINRQLDKQHNESVNSGTYDDYNSFMKDISLEPEVYDSHNEFSDSVGVANTGASNLSVRSDPNDVVMPWGLRRVNYHDAYALPDARVEHSEHPDQMYKQTSFLV